jgi:hypothetical protein
MALYEFVGTVNQSRVTDETASGKHVVATLRRRNLSVFFGMHVTAVTQLSIPEMHVTNCHLH